MFVRDARYWRCFWIALCSSLVFSLIMVKQSKTSKCPSRKVLKSALGFGPPGSALATT